MGQLIVFEGIDGCGKTTQIALLEEFLKKKKLTVVRLREPGGTPLGENIRAILADPAGKDMVPLAECLLFSASRAQLVETIIAPTLALGHVVLLDRYYYSTAAYQGAADKLGVDTILQLAEKTFRFPRPNLVVVLDIDPAVAASRSRRDPDRIEQKGLAYQQRVRDAFLAMANKDPLLFNVIDAAAPIERVHHEIVELVKGVV